MSRIKNQSPKVFHGSAIWHTLTGMTHRLYHMIGGSFLGRGLTSYRRADTLLHHQRRRALRDDCRPMSSKRAYLLEAVHESRLFRFFSGICSAAAHGSIRFFGWFGLFYSFFGALLHVIEAYIRIDEVVSFSRLLFYLVMAVISFPLLLTKSSAVQLLTRGCLTRWFFVGLLGLPEDQLAHSADTRKRTGLHRVTPYMALLLAITAAVLTLWIHPLVLPIAFLILCLVGMIIAFPETGVVLSVMTLPLTLWSTKAFALSVFLILSTWVGYAIKLVLMRRSIHFNLLDVSVLIWGLSLCLAGATGEFVTSYTILRGVLGLLLISQYFLITNLMASKQQLRRCIVGLGVSLAFVVAVTLIGSLPADLLNWMAGSRAGNFLVRLFGDLRYAANAHIYAHDICILLMAIPFIGALVCLQKRFLHRMAWLLLMGLCLFCLWTMGFFSALCVTMLCLLAFFLLYNHRHLAALILSLPALVCGGVWFYATFEEKIRQALVRIMLGAHRRGQLWKGAWRAVCDHPGGIGLGHQAAASVLPTYAEAGYAGVTGVSSLYMTVLLKMGIPGLIILLFVVFLFLQKTFSCLNVCERREDTMMIMGGTMSLIALLGFGLLSDTPTALSIIFFSFIALGLCSAYENMIFEAWDATTAGMAGSEERVDFVMHHPGA